MLSAIVQKVTGTTLLDYLRPRLFEPLGIHDPKWDASPQGISYGGFGLSVTTEDIARFGQLYLQKGEWDGRRIAARRLGGRGHVAPGLERQQPGRATGSRATATSSGAAATTSTAATAPSASTAS